MSMTGIKTKNTWVKINIYVISTGIFVLIFQIVSVNFLSGYYSILLISIGYCLIYIILSAFSIILRRFRWAVFYTLLGATFLYALLAHDQVRYAIDVAKLVVFDKKFSQCAAEASNETTSDIHLKVCERRSIYSSEVISTIIYDPSAQIILDSKNRTLSWKTSALNIQSSAPFGEMGFTAHKIIGNFYDVQFSSESQSDF